jgi:hypothetical protein
MNQLTLFDTSAPEVLESKPLSMSDRRDAVIDELRYYAEQGLLESELKDLPAARELKDMEAVVEQCGRWFLKWAAPAIAVASLILTGCASPRSVGVKYQDIAIHVELNDK